MYRVNPSALRNTGLYAKSYADSLDTAFCRIRGASPGYSAGRFRLRESIGTGSRESKDWVSRQLGFGLLAGHYANFHLSWLCVPILESIFGNVNAAMASWYGATPYELVRSTSALAASHSYP